MQTSLNRRRHVRRTCVVMAMPLRKNRTQTVSVVRKRTHLLSPSFGNSSTNPVTTVSISTIYLPYTWTHTVLHPQCRAVIPIFPWEWVWNCCVGIDKMGIKIPFPQTSNRHAYIRYNIGSIKYNPDTKARRSRYFTTACTYRINAA